MDELIYSLAAILAVTLPWFAVFAAIRLHVLSRSKEGRGIVSLRERSNTASLLAAASIIVAFLGINRFISLFYGEPLISGGAIVLLLAALVVLTSLPGLYWTLLYAHKGFEDGPGAD